MRLLRSVPWLPLLLVVGFVGAAVGLFSLQAATHAVLLVGGVNGTTLGVWLLMAAGVAGFAVVVRFLILCRRIPWALLRVPLRLAGFLLLLVSPLVGYALLFAAGFSERHYAHFSVQGRGLVVESWRWHHTNYALLERDGLLYRPVSCSSLGTDRYSPFPHGEYDLVEHGGSALLRFAEEPGGDHTGRCVLGPRETSPVTARQHLFTPLIPLPIPPRRVPPGRAPTPSRPPAR